MRPPRGSRPRASLAQVTEKRAASLEHVGPFVIGAGRWAHLSLARGDGLVDLICLQEEVVEVWGLRRGRRDTTRA